jgi:hypothetical protein
MKKPVNQSKQLMRKDLQSGLLISSIPVITILYVLACILYAKSRLGHWPLYVADSGPIHVLGLGYLLYMVLVLSSIPCLLSCPIIIVKFIVEKKPFDSIAIVGMMLLAVGCYIGLAYLPGTSVAWFFFN